MIATGGCSPGGVANRQAGARGVATASWSKGGRAKGFVNKNIGNAAEHGGLLRGLIAWGVGFRFSWG